MLVLSNVEGRILFLSGAYSGSTHDYSLLKDKFPPQKAAWFDETYLYVNLGFLGIGKNYKAKELNIPQKRGKKKT